ncbi:MAG: pilus assembly protein [Microbacteriaceae bacterium]|nr:pilus assembly protein [Burkholderiaceae bacterium]
MIELLVVLVIVGILAGVAWPSFREAVQRSRRADAMSALTEIMQAQERWRSNNPTYSASLTLPEPDWRTVSRDGHYTISLSDVTASTYTAVATVVSTSPQASDSRCQVMRVVVDRGNINYTSGASSEAINAQPDPCWVR